MAEGGEGLNFSEEIKRGPEPLSPQDFEGKVNPVIDNEPRPEIASKESFSQTAEVADERKKTDGEAPKLQYPESYEFPKPEKGKKVGLLKRIFGIGN
jgi:hypothetical protein